MLISLQQLKAAIDRLSPFWTFKEHYSSKGRFLTVNFFHRVKLHRKKPRFVRVSLCFFCNIKTGYFYAKDSLRFIKAVIDQRHVKNGAKRSELAQEIETKLLEAL